MEDATDCDGITAIVGEETTFGSAVEDSCHAEHAEIFEGLVTSSCFAEEHIAFNELLAFS